MKKKTMCIVAVLVGMLSGTFAWDINYTVYPVNMQIFPRDRVTDTAVVTVAGNVTNGEPDALILRVYRDDVLSSVTTQTLFFASGSAPFSFDTVIPAELSNYDFKMWVLDGGVETFNAQVLDVVAGDVFIIQGQSNADAQKYNDSANGNQHPFLRSFGMNSDNATTTANDVAWKQADGDGSQNIIGGVGQWGLRMGRQLLDEHHIPIAILNGAHGGRRIGFFRRNDTNPEDLNTNYGRLLYRARLAGITNGVRSILWYQGEADAGNGELHETGFVALSDDWREDFPSVERIYIHQLRTGCGVDKNSVDLRDRQRLLPDKYPYMSVMSTTGINEHDGCHFYYVGGYKLVGDHISALLDVDLYGSANTANTTAPNIKYITTVR